MFRLSVPEVIRFNRSSYNDEDAIETEEDVGPEIMHIYQVKYCLVVPHVRIL